MRLKCRKRYKSNIIIILILVISTGFGLVMRRLENPFSDAFYSYAVKAGNDAVNDAVSQCMDNRSITYNDLINLKENSKGEIISLSADTAKINRLKADISKTVDNNIKSYKGESLHINFGASQDNILLASVGPVVKIKVKPYSATKTEFRDEFISAGINQVRHCIYLDIFSTVTISGFNMRKTHNVENTILIADTIIVGSVPEFYGSCFADFNKFGE